eukprot:GGOE01000526.1.p1 GENE.GGOE01000526.1~~GGOE01000526.1.p1  ORF type:complete len:237 (-),score=64.51 GGOE01000526.1:167-856(-)
MSNGAVGSASADGSRPPPLTVSPAVAHSSASNPVKLEVHHLVNYTFGTKDAQPEKESAPLAELQRLKVKYLAQGIRRTVEAVLVVHQHNHPHILLLQSAGGFRLPGGHCKPDESEVACLKRKLMKKLGPPEQYVQPSWEVGQLLGTYWRPHFDHSVYPYLPPHLTKPKECRLLFLVPLPERRTFAVPRNLKLLAVPLFELYENPDRYGTLITEVPILISRFGMTFHGPA